MLGYADGQWKLLADRGIQGNPSAGVTLAADEELDSSRLNDLRFALNDLQIVDVMRKPAALSPDLTTSKGALTEEDVAVLENCGFYPVRSSDLEKIGLDLGPVGNHPYELLSNEGQVRCLMNNGVEYVLRFGETASTPGSGQPEKAKDKKQKGPAKEDKTEPAAQNRYLLVMAQFNPDGLRKPDLRPLPEEKPAETAKPAAAAKSAAGKPAKPDAKKPETKKPEAKAAPKRDLKLQREAIQRYNQQEQERFDREAEQGQARAKILNERFANWYYVISNETYKKIHLSRAARQKEGEGGRQSGNLACRP